MYSEGKTRGAHEHRHRLECTLCPLEFLLLPRQHRLLVLILGITNGLELLKVCPFFVGRLLEFSLRFTVLAQLPLLGLDVAVALLDVGLELMLCRLLCFEGVLLGLDGCLKGL